MPPTNRHRLAGAAAAVLTLIGLGSPTAATAQTRYEGYEIYHRYDPFDTIPGSEIQGGLGNGRFPSPARPLILDAAGNPVDVETNALLPGPKNVDPRRYGTIVMTPYQRRLYFAKDPVAYARRHRYDRAHRHWPGEATNPVVASTGDRLGPGGAARPQRADGRRGYVRRPVLIGDPVTP